MAYGGKLTGLRFVGPTVLTTLRTLIVVVVTPEDPDDDVSINERLDREGNSVYAARLWLRFAADTLREAEFSPTIRSVPDRRLFRWTVDGWDKTSGLVHTIDLISLRAGEAGGVRAIEIDAQVKNRKERLGPADTTARLDRDGNSVIPPELSMRATPDDIREASIVTAPGTSQDRFRHDFRPENPRTGYVHTLEFSCLRAGEAGGLRAVEVEADDIMGPGISKFGAELT